jgi:hypothetical protein
VNEVLNVLGFLVGLGIYLFLCHLIAKRGHSTGLFYNRVFVLAIVFSVWVAVWVYVFRTPRRFGRKLDV